VGFVVDRRGPALQQDEIVRHDQRAGLQPALERAGGIHGVNLFDSQILQCLQVCGVIHQVGQDMLPGAASVAVDEDGGIGDERIGEAEFILHGLLDEPADDVLLQGDGAGDNAQSFHLRLLGFDLG